MYSGRIESVNVSASLGRAYNSLQVRILSARSWRHIASAILVAAGGVAYLGWLWLFSRDIVLEAISMARGKPYYRAGEGPAQVTSAA